MPTLPGKKLRSQNARRDSEGNGPSRTGESCKQGLGPQDIEYRSGVGRNALARKEVIAELGGEQVVDRCVLADHLDADNPAPDHIENDITLLQLRFRSRECRSSPKQAAQLIELSMVPDVVVADC